MSEIPQVQELVMFNGEQAVTDTRVLAATFGKRHKNVLQAYDRSCRKRAVARGAIWFNKDSLARSGTYKPVSVGHSVTPAAR